MYLMRSEMSAINKNIYFFIILWINGITFTGCFGEL